jgi:TMEM175 potassium channel family protein
LADIGLPGKGPIEALTDGIFAVAMTLLVLDLRLPATLAAADDAGLRAALLALQPI